MKTYQTIYQVDAFTSEAFKGNPAGVCILESEPGEDWMQNIAMEMNLSETAFIIPREKFFLIRYFTPTTEVPLCGHATLASAHILYETGFVKPSDSISFKAKGGDLKISRNAGWIVMNFPAYSVEKINARPEFKEIVGFEPLELWSSNDNWIIAIADSEEDIINAQPRFETLIKNGLGHLMITARSRSKNIDFVVRCFAPLSGINEDPVTGSAHCALTPLWSEKLGKKEMNSQQVSKRTGILKVKLLQDRVEIKGKAMTIFKADLKI